MTYSDAIRTRAHGPGGRFALLIWLPCKQRRVGVPSSVWCRLNTAYQRQHKPVFCCPANPATLIAHWQARTLMTCLWMSFFVDRAPLSLQNVYFDASITLKSIAVQRLTAFFECTLHVSRPIIFLSVEVVVSFCLRWTTFPACPVSVGTTASIY